MAAVDDELRAKGASPEVRAALKIQQIGSCLGKFMSNGCIAMLASLHIQVNQQSHLPAPAQVREYVAEVLESQYGRFDDFMTKEADMRRELQRYISTLEVSSRVFAEFWPHHVGGP